MITQMLSSYVLALINFMYRYGYILFFGLVLSLNTGCGRNMTDWEPADLSMLPVSKPAVQAPINTGDMPTTSTATSAPSVSQSPVVQSPVATSTTAQSPVATSTTVQSPVATSTAVQSPVATSTAVQSPVATSTTAQSPVTQVQSACSGGQIQGEGIDSNGTVYQYTFAMNDHDADWMLESSSTGKAGSFEIKEAGHYRKIDRDAHGDFESACHHHLHALRINDDEATDDDAQADSDEDSKAKIEHEDYDDGNGHMIVVTFDKDDCRKHPHVAKYSCEK